MWHATLLAALLSAAAAQDDSKLSNCVSYNDGCNTCGVKNGEMTFCTEMACEESGTPHCLKCEPGFVLKGGACKGGAKPVLRAKKLKNGDPCYRFCESGSKAFVNRRNDCEGDLKCKSTLPAGQRSFDTCGSPWTCQADGKATEAEATEASSYYYNPYYYAQADPSSPAPAPSAPTPSKWCAASGPQMCKMLCRKQPSCGEGMCAMRKGTCCDWTCQASSGGKVPSFTTVTTTAKPKAAEKCTGCCPPMANCFAPDPPCCAKDKLNKEKLQQQMLEASRKRREEMKNSGVGSKRRQGIQNSTCLANDAKWQPDKFNQMLCGMCMTCAPCYGQKLVEHEQADDDDEGSKPAAKTVRRKTREEMAAAKTKEEKCGCLQTNKAPADTCTDAKCQKCAPFCNRCFGVSRTAFSDRAGKKQADKTNEVQYEDTPDGTAAIITT